MVVDFNKYKREKEGIKTCQLILEEITTKRDKEGKIYRTSDMEGIATRILCETDNENSIIVPVVEIAKEFKFDTFQKRMPWFLSGFIKINEKCKKKFRTDHVICINVKVNPYQQRFVIAHELAHYLFDYNHASSTYYNTYIKNDHKTESERRANTFAANPLMPRTKFAKEYIKAAKINSDPIFIMVYLSDTFKAPRKAVLKRMSEVGCNAFSIYR